MAFQAFNSAQCANASVRSIGPGANMVGGNYILVAFVGTAGVPANVIDDQSNSYTLLKADTINGSLLRYLFAARNATVTTSMSISMFFNAPGTGQLIAVSLSGRGTSTPEDGPVQANIDGNPGTAHNLSTTLATSVAADDLVAIAVWTATGTTGTASGSWVKRSAGTNVLYYVQTIDAVSLATKQQNTFTTTANERAGDLVIAVATTNVVPTTKSYFNEDLEF
jgi:hypothetical protein